MIHDEIVLVPMELASWYLRWDSRLKSEVRMAIGSRATTKAVYASNCHDPLL